MAEANEEKLSEDDIDSLKMPKAIKLCKKFGIDLSNDIKLYQMKWLLKYELLCKKSTRKEVLSQLGRYQQIDVERREALGDIFSNTLMNTAGLLRMEDPVVDQVKELFPDCINTLKKGEERTLDGKAPVLVLGETGAGKSSFINLLLDSDILPCSILSNTHIVCEIMHSGDSGSSAQLHKFGATTHVPEQIYTRQASQPVSTRTTGTGSTHEDEKQSEDIVDTGGTEDFKQKLGTAIQSLDHQGRPIYHKADLYLPSDILKTGLVIVDSPGIGDRKETEDLVLDYILNAGTFIYVIDSTSAGGMQARMQELLHKVYKRALEDEKEYRPESAIFICNKWDEVPVAERDDVWEDTVRKIKTFWPKCDESQIFKFSTLEAAYIHARGGISPKFGLILDRINKLVPIGREIMLMRGYRLLDHFISQCDHCFGTHLQQVKLSTEERENKQRDTRHRLAAIKNNMDKFFEAQLKNLRADIKDLAAKLHTYLNSPENMADICTFSESEIPKCNSGKEMAVAVRAKVYDKILLKTRQWEDEQRGFKAIGDNLSKALEEGFPSFTAEIYEVQQSMSRAKDQEAEPVPEEEEVTLIPKVLLHKFDGLTFGMRVALGIGLAPALVVGMAVRLPVFGFQTLKKLIQTTLVASEFEKAKSQKEGMKKIVEKYAGSTVEAITEKMKLESIIEEDMQPLFVYMKQQRQRMELQIQSDLALLDRLKEEERSDQDILNTYDPLRAKFEILRRRLRYFLAVNMPGKMVGCRVTEIPCVCITLSDKVIGTGLGADILQAQCNNAQLTGGFGEVCVRRGRDQGPSSVHRLIKAMEAYSLIQTDFIVKCFGFTSCRGALYQVLEPLHACLRSVLPCMMQQAGSRSNEIDVKQEVVTSIVTGLKFLHDKKFVHFDLSLDTVMVDKNHNIKLTNISKEGTMRLHVPDGKLAIGNYVHIIPDSFQGPTKVTYTSKDDMYAVGVLMWEVWVGQAVVNPDSFTDTEILNGDAKEFRKMLEGFRPQRDPHFKLTDEMNNSRIVDEWWTTINGCLNGKITSQSWLERWKQITHYPELTIVYSEDHFRKTPKDHLED